MGNPLVDIAADPQGTADRLAAMPQIVGIQIAGISDDGITAGAAGVTDLDTSDPVDASTRFRPGSITKAITATLVMQLVDDGVCALDDPVSRYVPELVLAESGATDRITLAHLLAHSSGIDAGDLFIDTGDDDDCRLRYIERLRGAGLLFEPGTTFSYNNAGFVIAGLVVERLRDMTFEEVIRTRLIEPLGMTSTTFLTGKEEDALDDTRHHARGHLAGFGGAMAVPPGTLSDDPMTTRGLAPAGATVSSTAGDLARFAGAHLGLKGIEPVLSAESAALMRQLHTRAPGGVTKMAGVGFGWQIWRGDDGLKARIGGANPGQSGVIATDATARHAIVALSNSDQGVNMINVSLDGFGPAAVPDDDPPPDDLSPYEGTYRCDAFEVAVSVGDAGLSLSLLRADDARWGATRMVGLLKDAQPDMAALQNHALTAVDRTTFSSPLGPIAFLRNEAGEVELLRWRMRALRKA